MKYLFLVIILFLAFTNSANAQKVKNEIVKVETIDGNIIVGKISKKTKKYLHLDTKSAGVVKINRSSIKSIDKASFVSSLEEEKVYKSYPSKYFLGGSGYGLSKGEGYYSNVGIFLNEVNYGITSNIAIGAGLVPLFLFDGGATPIWLKTKFSIPIVENKINFGFGAMLGSITGKGVRDELALLGDFSAIFTFGSRGKNISVGLNWIYGDSEIAAPFIKVSGKYQVSNRSYLILDSFTYHDKYTSSIAILGARTLFHGLALDYGGLIPLGDLYGEGLYIYPYLGIKIGFGYN